MADAGDCGQMPPEAVAWTITTERPDALLPTEGEQTAMNTALSLFTETREDTWRKTSPSALNDCKPDAEEDRFGATKAKPKTLHKK